MGERMIDLKEISKNIDDLFEIVYCGFDGVIIDSHQNKRSGIIIDLFASQLADVFKKLKINGVNPKDIISTYDNYILIIKSLSDGFIFTVLDKEGNAGRTRIELNKIKEV
jgi:hypothetical protein